MQKVHDIPVLHDIALALGAQLASLACLGLAAQRDIIGKSDGFVAGEALLEIVVETARRLGRGRALVDGPRARRLWPADTGVIASCGESVGQCLYIRLIDVSFKK